MKKNVSTKAFDENLITELIKRKIALEPIILTFGLPNTTVDGPIHAVGIARQSSGEALTGKDEPGKSGQESSLAADPSNALLRSVLRGTRTVRVERIGGLIQAGPL